MSETPIMAALVISLSHTAEILKPVAIGLAVVVLLGLLIETLDQ